MRHRALISMDDDTRTDDTNADGDDRRTDDANADGDGVERSRRGFLAGSALLGAGVFTVGGKNALAAGAERLLQVTTPGAPETTFRVRIENTATEPIEASNGETYPVVFSPGAFAAHARGEPIFTDDEPERNNGLEEVAEDGAPGRLGESLAALDFVSDSGVFTTPVGADGPGPLTPGNAYEFEVAAGGLSRYLSLASMFVPSNDLFVASRDDGGIRLFDEDGPVSGDVTGRLGLWDAGTEINEEPGAGANQVQNQPAANVGLTERGTVVPVAEVNGYDYPDLADVLSVSVTPVDGDGGGGGNGDGGGGEDGDGSDDDGSPRTAFTVRVENVSTGSTLETSAGPVAVPLSPGAYAVHSGFGAMFFPGRDATEGLERLAEDGSPGTLAEELRGRGSVAAAGAFTTPVDADGPGPIGPGGAYEFAIDAAPGDRLSFATMFVQSNDLFYAPRAAGVELFDGDRPVDGDVTRRVFLWDAGTEANEEPGVGPNQAPRQSGPDTGPAEDEVVREIANVADGYDYPPTDAVIRVTVTPDAGE